MWREKALPSFSWPHNPPPPTHTHTPIPYRTPASSSYWREPPISFGISRSSLCVSHRGSSSSWSEPFPRALRASTQDHCFELDPSKHVSMGDRRFSQLGYINQPSFLLFWSSSTGAITDCLYQILFELPSGILFPRLCPGSCMWIAWLAACCALAGGAVPCNVLAPEPAALTEFKAAPAECETLVFLAKNRAGVRNDKPRSWSVVRVEDFKGLHFFNFFFFLKHENNTYSHGHVCKHRKNKGDKKQ